MFRFSLGEGAHEAGYAIALLQVVLGGDLAHLPVTQPPHRTLRKEGRALLFFSVFEVWWFAIWGRKRSALGIPGPTAAFMGGGTCRARAPLWPVWWHSP